MTLCEEIIICEIIVTCYNFNYFCRQNRVIINIMAEHTNKTIWYISVTINKIKLHETKIFNRQWK
jgi:D-mannonate dehydratase